MVATRAFHVFCVVQQFSLCRQVLDPNRFHVRFNNFNQGPTSLCNWVRTILNWDSAVSITSLNPSTVSELGLVGSEGDLQMAKASAASSPSPRRRFSLSSFSTAARTTRNKETRATATTNNIRHQRRARQNHNHCHHNNNHHNHHNKRNHNHNDDNSHNNHDSTTHNIPATSKADNVTRHEQCATQLLQCAPAHARPQDTFEDTERGGFVHGLRDPARR